MDRDDRRNSPRYRGLEIYRLSDAPAAAAEQDRHSGACAITVMSILSTLIRRWLEFLVSHQQASFIRIDEGEHRLDLGASGHAGFFFSALENLGKLVVPAALPHEFIPNVNLIVCRAMSHAEAPLQNFLIGPALFDAFDVGFSK